MPAPNETLPDIIRANQTKILSVAVPSVQNNSEIWIQRAIVEISQNKDLSDFVTGGGKNQLIIKLAKAAQVGLQIGGTKPHAYFVNMNGQLRMDITKEGYAHVIVYGQGAVLSHVPQIIEVKELDTRNGFYINQAEGVVRHEYNPFDTNRGNTVGWYTILEYKNGRKEIAHISMDKVKKIRDGYSMVNSPAWKKSESEMLEKIATKQLLKKPFAESEGLAMLINSIDIDELGDEPPLPPQPKDVTERASLRVDSVLNTMGEGTEIEPPAKVEKPSNEKTVGEPVKPDLF